MHPEFERICEYVKIYKNSIEKIVIQSNGEIGKIDKSLLKSFNSIHLSYDIDDLGIRVGGEENLNLAKKLNEEGIYTYLFSTVHKKNLNYIDEFVKRANQVHVDLGFNIYCDTGVDSGLALTTEEKLRVCKKLNILSKDGKILSFKNPMVSILENRSSEVFAGIRGGCSAGIASCDILPNGDVLPCPFLRLPVGNIYDNNLAEIWFESNILKALRDRRVYKGQCRKCPHLSYCGGCRKVAYEYTKDIQGEDPTCFKSLWSLK